MRRTGIRLTSAGDVLLRNAAVAPGEDADVEIAGSHIGQALVHRAFVGGHGVLRGDHVVPHLAQDVVDLLAVFHKVALRRCRLWSLPLLHHVGQCPGHSFLEQGAQLTEHGVKRWHVAHQLTQIISPHSLQDV